MSQCSQASTIPYENSQDPTFLSELQDVDNLFFKESDETSLNFDKETTNSIVTNDDSDDDCDIFYPADTVQDPLLEPSECDIENSASIELFRNTTCCCSQLYGKPCSTVVNFDDLLSLRDYCLTLERNELDLVVKTALFTHRKNGTHTSGTGHVIKERQKPSQRFYVKGIEVCRKVFCFGFCIGREKLMKIGKSLDEDGLIARIHGNKKKHPHNAISFTDRQEIVTFLCRYAKENALPLPGRMPNHRDHKVLLLPSDKRQSDVYEAYITLAAQMGLRSISLTSFVRTWHSVCPHILVNKPSTDLCHKCQMWAFQISNSGSYCESEKIKLLDDYKTHVKQADLQRQVYKSQCEETKEEFSTEFLQGAEPCSLDAKVHYSWDFAQQVLIPHHSQQVGPLYFKTPRKCEVFGVCCECSEKQVFYLADEGIAPGKGANTVISYIHHFLATYGFGETEALFHFDNCSSQNKNNAVLWYAIWRVMTGLHKKITYSMMVAGHTKFSPDMHFGIWKSRWRRVDAETVQEVAKSVKDSSKNGHNIPHIVNDPVHPVEFFDWKTFLGQLFKPLKNISKFHSFKILLSEPGCVIYKEFEDGPEQKVFVLKKGKTVTSKSMPEKINSPGLEIERQWYLYDEIRQFIKNDNAKEDISPLPQVEKTKPSKRLKKS